MTGNINSTTPPRSIYRHRKAKSFLHLSEHHGDASRGSKAYIETTDVRKYHKELIEKNYKFNKPGLEIAPWNAPCIEVIDPFSNKLLFTEKGT